MLESEHLDARFIRDKHDAIRKPPQEQPSNVAHVWMRAAVETIGEGMQAHADLFDEP